MDDELTPIRKVIDGIHINTDTAHCIHTNVKMVSEWVDGKTLHWYIHHGLYQVQGSNHYFFAFWNKPQWNEKSLQFEYVNDANLIDVSQAKQWVLANCPDKFDTFVKDLDKTDKAPSTTAVNLRMPTELRNYLVSMAELSKSSLNKICLNMLNSGRLYASMKSGVSLPTFMRLEMPNGEPALDEFEKARQFDDPDDQALANHAETLYVLYRHNFPAFFPAALQTLYQLVQINRDAKRAMCFAIWLASFHRATWQDSQEFSKRRKSFAEPGQWRWVKYEDQE